MAISEVIDGEGATAGTTAYNICDATAGNLAFDLPPLEACRGNGLTYMRVDATVNTVTITPCEASGVTIEGLASVTLNTQYDSLTFIAPASGSAWIVEAGGVGTGSGDALTSQGLDQFAATTSDELAGVLSDETGSGAFVRATSPTLTTPRINTFHTSTGATRRTITAEPVTPVNYFAETISATGDPVYTQAAGSDSNIDIGMAGKGTGAALLGPSVSEGSLSGWLRGGAGNLNRKVKKITGMTDATFVDLFTVTVPNAAHSAAIFMRCVGALGDADSTAAESVCVTVTRQSGENSILDIDTNPWGTAQPTSTGGQTVALTFQVSSLTGAAGATQTFTIQGKVTRGGGASDNHYMTVLGELLNQNSSGVTFT